MRLSHLRTDSIKIFRACIEAVDPVRCVKRYLGLEKNELKVQGMATFDLNSFDRIIVIGAGKASAGMAQGVEELLGNRISQGLVVVKYDHVMPLKYIEIIEAGHPTPDIQGAMAAEKIVALLKETNEQDLIISCISGGGSALLTLPGQGLELEDKQRVTEALLRAGADINEINTVRKHISGIKGGRLAKLCERSTVINLMISDVVGDDPGTIASGPFSIDPTTFEQARAVLERHGLLNKSQPRILDYIEKGCNGEIPETLKPGDPIFNNIHNKIIGSNITALYSGKEMALSLGYNSIILSSSITGDTSEAAAFHSAIAREIRSSGNPIAHPACVLSGGETTVRVTGGGKGGRNQQFALASLNAVSEIPDCSILSAGSDGTDGPTDAAGSIIDTSSLIRAKSMGLEPEDFLSESDSYNFFSKLGDLFKTGPTGVNVMDLRIILIG